MGNSNSFLFVTAYPDYNSGLNSYWHCFRCKKYYSSSTPSNMFGEIGTHLNSVHGWTQG